MRSTASAGAGRRWRPHAIGAALLLILCLLTLVTEPASPAVGTSLRFGGGGIATPGLDRVMIPVDPPTSADLGATDFTIEFWMLATAADNPSGDVACDQANYSWIEGHIVFDRDRFPGGASSDGRDFGISVLTDGRLAFGVENASNSQWTTCTTGVNVLDGTWHHVAVQRTTASGLMEIWVDGVRRANATGPTGDISYPNGAATNRPGSDPYLVIGAEKHDVGTDFPSYRGLIDEVRLSDVRRYTAAFSRPTAAFATDAGTAALYHFDAPVGRCAATLPDASGQVNASCRATATLPAHDATVPFVEPPTTTTTLPTTTSTTTLPPPTTTTTTTTTTTVPPTTTTTTTTLPPTTTTTTTTLPPTTTTTTTTVPPTTTTTTTTTALPPTTTTTATTVPPTTTTTTTLPPTTTTTTTTTTTVPPTTTTSTTTTTTTTTVPPTTTTTLPPNPGPSGDAFNLAPPTRLLDTRPTGPLPAGQVVEVQVGGQAGIPSGAPSATLNLTVTRPSAPGFLTAYPCGTTRPNVSNLNFGTGETIANAATVATGAGGRVCVYSSATTEVIVDAFGWWEPTGQRFQPVTPDRLADTRATAALPAGGVLRVQVWGNGAPDTATAAAVTLTSVSPQAPGFLTAYRCDQTRPVTSNLNYGAFTIANLATVPLDATGALCVYTASPTSVLVDLTGWWGPGGSTGLVGATPAVRLLDTRPGVEIQAGATVAVTPGDGATAAALNLTTIRSSAAGFLTAWPCGQLRPTTSSLNYTAGRTVAAATIVATGLSGQVCIFSSATTHLIVDVFGRLLV